MSKATRNKRRQAASATRPGAGGSKQRQAQGRIARMRAEEARRRRRVRWTAGAAAAAVVVIVAVVLALTLTGRSAKTPSASLRLAPLTSLGKLRPAPPPGKIGPETVPVPAGPALSAPAAATAGQPIDGIKCQTSEQLVFHIHAHLTVFVHGAARQVPYGIGIPRPQLQQTAQGPDVVSGACFYWLHSHAADGIIHIESPVSRVYTLGEFFDEWGQPLGPNQVGPATGRVVAIYNGQRYLGDPRNIPLTERARIQLEVGAPLVAPEPLTWPSGL